MTTTAADTDQATGQVIPFVFDDQLVRVITRKGEPWFVLSDLCRVLEIKNARDAAARLEPEEVMTVGIADGQGGPERNIVSESGLYALVFTSRKPEARQFRKWVTSEVLPAIRRAGRYDMREEPPRVVISGDLSLQEIALKLQMVREARLTFGTCAGRRLCESVVLPYAPMPVVEGASILGSEALDHLLCEEAPSGRRLSALLAAAMDGSKAAHDELRPLGIMVLDDEDGVVFANSVPFLVTSAAKGGFDHVHRLRHLSGARPWRSMRFCGHQSRGTFVPFAELEWLLRAVRDVFTDA